VPRVPTVLSVEEVRRLIEAIPAGRIYRLMAELLYGTGMRVSEVCTLRVRGGLSEVGTWDGRRLLSAVQRETGIAW
jgi:site-specific recombinase XerD